MKTRMASIALTIIAMCADTACSPQSNPPYTIEIRHVASDGTVIYEPQRYEQWDHTETIAGLRQHTPDIIFCSIYADGLQYCFSKSGHVYAMKGAQNEDPSYYDREWQWSGDPHQFPYYDYSKVSPLVGP